MRPARARSILAAFGAGLLVAGCDLAPHYEPPKAEDSGSFKEAVPPAPAEAQGWKIAEPRDDALRNNWWEMYGDPQLNDLEDRVAISNQTVAIAEANYRAARAMVGEAQAALFPNVTADPSVVRSRSSAAVTSGGSSGPTTSSGGGGGTGTRTYFTLPAEASYQVDLWGSVRNSLHLVRTLYNNGLASEEDLAEADTQLDAAEAQATDLGIARAQFEHAIAVLIGVPPAHFSVGVRPFNSALPTIPVGLPADLLERRPDIATAERQVAAANAGIGIARASYFPNLTLSASAGFESTSLSSLFDWPNRFWSFGPSVVQTLFDGGLHRAANELARAQYDQTVANYRQTVLAAFQSVEDDLTSLRILSKEVEQQHRAAVAAQHTVQLSVVRYQNGVDSYVNVITAQNTFLTNRLAELQVQLRQLAASVSLVNNLGGGWDKSRLGKTEAMAQHPPGAGSRAEPPPENGGPGIPNPAPLPVTVKRPEELLKQDEQDMSPAPTH
jgi:outer membrane protein TolC